MAFDCGHGYAEEEYAMNGESENFNEKSFSLKIQIYE